ncbi:ElyC/SanA/YdcF family protein [Streptococcus oricebi]|uniref:DUF218 domain-containing protein n=1 Tax=Streptococcus oricebi TaxID=1547447 RepID=A0ABS5B4I7_9STRE|nr:ElyC/SanA/YdcF family protein [Streptococcus oricebi]MBP2623758.1 hypothetical protein [Streptococcus oricebi]
MKEKIAEQINQLADFCGKRDLTDLSRASLQARYGLEQVDVFVLFGGSILAGGDLLAQAIRQGLAQHYLIVGGRGHTTASLEQELVAVGLDLVGQDLSEAQLFASYLQERRGLTVDFLETASTNCGNNISYLLDLLEREGLDFKSLIFCQDATMQLRMEAVWRKLAPQESQVINFASYQTRVRVKDGNLVYEKEELGMWDLERYLSLLLGEIPRLRDDQEGYGPLGKNYLAHVDIPDQVEQAFEGLAQTYSHLIRQANPRYASKEEK